VIEDLTYDVIIGRDFLQYFRSRIDFENGVLTFSREENSLPFCDVETDFLSDDVEDDNSDFMCSVHADFSFTIPPEVVISAKLSKLPETAEANGVVAPRSDLPHRSSIFGASGLVKVAKDGSIPIRMVNPSAQPVKIYRRTRLADFEQVDHNIATFQLNDVEKAEVCLPSCSVGVEDGTAQTDYSRFPDLSDSALSDGDKAKFHNLFKRYRDVFAFSDHQLGRTSLVQHVIKTGDAAPIKQRPYRTSPESKQEIGRQVNDMLERGIIQESVSPWSIPVVLVKKKMVNLDFAVIFVD